MSAGQAQVAARRRWAYRLIRRCPEPPPAYGTVDWLALPEGSVARIAAVVVAAEAWARSGDDLETELRREVDAVRQAHKQTEDADYQARAEAHRRAAPRWQRSFTQRRAEQLEAAQPKTDDFTGRGSA